jgi:hypothetical protein
MRHGCAESPPRRSAQAQLPFFPSAASVAGAVRIAFGVAAIVLAINGKKLPAS